MKNDLFKLRHVPAVVVPQLVLVSVLALVGITVYLSWPLAVDPSVHFTGIHQGVINQRPLGELWTFRGPVYNAYLWVLYQITTWFVPFQDAPRFSLLVRIFHLGVLSGVCALWAWGFTRYSRRFVGQGWLVFCLALLGCTSVYWTVHLHAEDVSNLFLLASLGCALAPQLSLRFVAGFLAGLLPLVKGITALFCLPAALAVFLPEQKRGRGVFCWGTGFALSILVQVLWLYKHDFLPLRDLLESAVFQSSTVASFRERWLSFQIHWLSYSGKHPLTVVAASAGTFLMTWLLLRRRFLQFFLGLTLWGFTLFALIFQDRYFTYHMGLSVPPTIFTLSCLTELYRERFSRREALLLLGATSCTWLFFLWQLDHPYALDFPFVRLAWLAPLFAFVVLAWSFWKSSGLALRWQIPLVASLAWLGFGVAWTLDKGTFPVSGHPTSLQRSMYREGDALRFFEKKHRLKNKQALLLAYGHMTRYLRVRSACRHFFPIPVQRLRVELEDTFVEQEGFRENRDCILSYHGELILLEPKWLRRSSFRAELREKLREYRRVDSLRINRERTLELYVRKPLAPKKKKKKKKPTPASAVLE